MSRPWRGLRTVHLSKLAEGYTEMGGLYSFIKRGGKETIQHTGTAESCILQVSDTDIIRH